MIEPIPCPECGASLPPGRPEGLCPSCLLRAAIGEEAPAPDADLLAAIFPEFEIVRHLGSGGMGMVYLVRQPSLDRLCALKILAPDLADSPGFRERFSREARTLAALNHPHIVTIHDFGEREGHFYFLMEYVDGGDLGRIIQSAALKPREALAIVPQICDALQYAHDKGVVHRDIKPGNILLDQEGRVKIADFGVAKIVGRPGDPGVPTGYVLGTPAYMAPEQQDESTSVDHRADIYSLGAVLFELLTGTPPGDPIVPPSQRVQIDVRLDQVVLRALQREPERRYQQVSEFREGIERVVGPRRRRALPWLLAGAATIAAGTLGIVWLGRSQEPPAVASADPYPPVSKNSLEMSFRPIPGTQQRRPGGDSEQAFTKIPGSEVKMSIWETRESDWDAFLGTGTNASQQLALRHGPDHPVTTVAVGDAEAFCRWLTRKEQAEGTIRADELYRLPTDAEWSLAVGLDEPADAASLPADQRDQVTYPWGRREPAPPDAGNYADSTLGERMSGIVTLPNYYDGHAGTAPAGSFPPNENGFHDLGGNVWEWVQPVADGTKGILRGGSWASGARDGDWSCLLSSARADEDSVAVAERGFRIVLAPAADTPPPTLLGAARDGDLGTVVALLDAGASVGQRNAQRSTPLHLAAREGHAEIVAALLAAGADAEARDRTGEHPLHAAARSGSLETVKQLVEAGASTRALSRVGRETPLHLAAMTDQPELLDYLCQHGAAVDATRVDGWTPLDNAILAGASASCQWLLDHGADPDKVARKYGTYPLMIAVLTDNTEIVNVLLDAGAGVDGGRGAQFTPLAFAVMLGRAGTVEVLLARGANPNDRGVARALGLDVGKVAEMGRKSLPEGSADLLLTPPEPGSRARIVRLLDQSGFDLEQRDDHGYTPLLNAAYHGNTEVFQALVGVGADVDATDDAGFTSLHSAIEQGSERIAEILIAQGADLEAETKDGRRPLHVAAMTGSASLVERLLGAGAEIDPRDQSGGTPLHYAAWHGRPLALRVLIAAGADIQTRSENGRTALISCAGGPEAMESATSDAIKEASREVGSFPVSRPSFGNEEDYRECVRQLLAAGANVRALRSDGGTTALHRAARFNQVATMRLLLDAGAGLNAPNRLGFTPLYAAAESNAAEAAAFLLENKAGLTSLLGSRTPLHAATLSGSLKVMIQLLDAGADPNSLDGLAATPLHLAAEADHLEAVELLLSRGAKVEARDWNYFTPLHYAVARDDPELIRILCQAGADPRHRNLRGLSAIDLARGQRKQRALDALNAALQAAESPPPSAIPEEK